MLNCRVQYARCLFLAIFVSLIVAPEAKGQNPPQRPTSETELPSLQRKMDALVRSAIAQMRSEGIDRSNAAAQSAAQRFSTPLIKVDNRARIHVYLELTEVTPNRLAALGRPEDIEIEITNDNLKLVQAWVPYDRLETLAALDFVVRIRPPSYGTPRTGSVNSQGDAILKANLVRNTRGITGSGIKVGVISDGANGSAAAIASGDLPANLTIFGTCSAGPCNEGTAMAEIVYDLAPGAGLAIGQINTSLDFIQRITDLRNWGAKVIVDDIGFILEPYFEHGSVANAYATALAAGVVMISAAGNDAQSHYQGVYVSSGVEIPGFGTLHNFGGGDTTMRFTAPPNSTTILVLQWSNRFGQSGDNYDLCFTDPTGAITLGCSRNSQTGTQNPIEPLVLSCSGSGACESHVQIFLLAGAAQTLELFFFGAGTPTELIVAADSIYGHPAVPGVIATAAIAANNPGNLTIEPYSSRGPSTIAFPVPQQIATPALTTIDCVSVTGAGSFPTNFCGTSAAAPHAAAVAALLLQANPSLTPPQIKSLMETTAADRGTAAFDNTYGSGLVDALAAVVAATSPNQAPSAISVTPASGSGLSQTFSFLFSDPNGASDLNYALVLINGTQGPGHISGCVSIYVRASNQLLLLNDAGNNWLGPGTLGMAGTLQNSQCSINLQASSASPSGTNLALNLAMTFQVSFAGQKNILMLAGDNGGLDSGWQYRGSWTVAGQPPLALSVTPSSGSGFSQNFGFLYSDPDGASDLNYLLVLINGTQGPGHIGGCIPLYVRASNQLLLLNDAGTSWLGPGALGMAGTLQNSQCSINLQTSSALPSGANLTMNLAVTFKGGFAGQKIILMLAGDNGGLDSGWQYRGAWTVP